MFLKPKSAVLWFGALAAAVALPTSAAWEMRVCADYSRMPFSNAAGEGFEDKIAEIIADELGATLVFELWPRRDVLVGEALRPGDCDVIIGAGDDGTTLNTLAYYRSPFVFVYRAAEDYDIFTFDDPILRELRLGVHRSSAAHEVLMLRDLGEAIEEYPYVGGVEDPLAPPIEAVANNEIDVAIVWGPAAGYYAAQQGVELVVQPVPPFEPPFTEMYINISVGVRLGDEALRDAIDIALANRWDDIYAILDEYNIPYLDLPRPTLTIEVPR
jgi:quinoprotein dehydrogenase-associated probable ABC transporter substrate-binding protein